MSRASTKETTSTSRGTVDGIFLSATRVIASKAASCVVPKRNRTQLCLPLTEIVLACHRAQTPANLWQTSFVRTPATRCEHTRYPQMQIQSTQYKCCTFGGHVSLIADSAPSYAACASPDGGVKYLVVRHSKRCWCRATNRFIDSLSS